MASRDSAPAPHSRNPDTLPGQPPEPGDTASVLSSRMTDIASEDGGEYAADAPSAAYPAPVSRRPSQKRSSTLAGESRPNTGVSSHRGAPFAQVPPSRRGYANPQRSSVSTIASRPQSATSRSHVPSLQSHAFFRPMSSQRLQQQRGARPPTMPQLGIDDSSTQGGSEARRQSLVSSSTAMQGQSIVEDGDGPRPLSRGTEATEPYTAGMRTANTSPTNGYTATASMSESVRPLQRDSANPKGLSVNTDKSYKTAGRLPTPSKSPRSFRSSFLLPSRGDAAPISPNRSTQGREKLPSVASSPALTPTDAVQKQLPKPQPGNNSQYFTGNTVFCWGGRLQNTRDKPVNIATGLFAFVPGVLFFIFSAPWLWHNISPAIPVLFAYVFYICMSSFFHASFSDPGILPRNLHPMPPPDPNEDPLTLGPSMNDWTVIKSAHSPGAAMEVPTKYCKTCNIWRPPRGHHCRVCDSCIETQDHHCVWLNNCIGRRNYRYFFGFVTFCTIEGSFLLAASLAQILLYMKREHITFGASISHFRVPFAMVIYAALATPYPAALMGYHLFLMGRGDTTREYLNSHKFLKKDRHRPFTQGSIFKNWLVVLARPRPPTYLRLKAEHEEGDQRFGERRGKRSAPLKEEFQGQGVEMQNVGFQGPTTMRAEPRP